MFKVVRYVWKLVNFCAKLWMIKSIRLLCIFKIIVYHTKKMSTHTFKHVDYLWDEAHAHSLKDDQVALFLYRSNLLGADLRITNYGGGNTSCKTIEKDPKPQSLEQNNNHTSLRLESYVLNLVLNHQNKSMSLFTRFFLMKMIRIITLNSEKQIVVIRKI